MEMKTTMNLLGIIPKCIWSKGKLIETIQEWVVVKTYDLVIV